LGELTFYLEKALFEQPDPLGRFVKPPAQLCNFFFCSLTTGSKISQGVVIYHLDHLLAADLSSIAGPYTWRKPTPGTP
jgi:hypothetical protein